MSVMEVVVGLVGGLLVMIVGAAVVFVDLDRLATTVRSPQARFVEVAPHLAVLGAVLFVNRLFRHLGQNLSWIIGWNITNLIHAIENGFVATVQSLATPWLTTYFAFIYLYGYAFLVVFPVLAYWVLEDPEPIRRTILAFATNYALGLLGYTLFISYGPRNLLPKTVKPLLYVVYPQAQLLTSVVNANTNVFPSLHASLAITVVLLSYGTRNRYPGWFALCVPLATSVVLSTMYLGIHWALDVVAGLAVAVVSVRLADRYHDSSGWAPSWYR